MGEISIWANFDAHSAAIRKIGGTDADVELLRKAATAVEEAQREAAKLHTDPARAALPITIEEIGWTIAPPTKEARTWALRAVLAVTGGREPSAGQGQLMAIVAGLWALERAGQGCVDEVMQAICGAGELAGIITRILEKISFSDALVGRLAEAYGEAMGFRLPPLLAGAAADYAKAVEVICARILQNDMQRSLTSRSSPTASSAPAGTTTGVASRPPSSTRRSRPRSASKNSARRRSRGNRARVPSPKKPPFANISKH